ncbi:hypothetical protein TNCT_237021 [Trichonephila clavata]|uniref:Uncharacterized protein n=1 Tax=Trichonephila clavata TaxID=2740835 RepID=A0A8X6ICX6_TRICU|nr:hypothetical protein TNCT_237021 [Trichonephila clavata]
MDSFRTYKVQEASVIRVHFLKINNMNPLDCENISPKCPPNCRFSSIELNNEHYRLRDMEVKFDRQCRPLVSSPAGTRHSLVKLPLSFQ